MTEYQKAEIRYGVIYAAAGCLPDHDGWLGVFDTVDEAEAYIEECRQSGEWDSGAEYNTYDFDIMEIVHLEEV